MVVIQNSLVKIKSFLPRYWRYSNAILSLQLTQPLIIKSKTISTLTFAFLIALHSAYFALYLCLRLCVNVLVHSLSLHLANRCSIGKA